MNATKPSDSMPAATTAADARLKAILGLVGEQGFQSIDMLAERFGVSTQTIRRDVNTLCERGLCRRRHGGVDVLPENVQNVAYTARRILHREAKQAIARCVAQAVPEGASLFFGIGTTPEECAAALHQRQALRVMTNNLNVVAALRRNPGCELVMAGGRLRNTDNDVVAGEAHEFFSRYAADIGIYGVGGVAEDGSLLDFSQDEVRMRSELAKHCRQRYLVLDHSKFGRSATVRGGHITEAHRVFTDRPVPAPIAAMLLDAGVQLVVASSLTYPPLALTEGEH
ncbi:MAG: DeoR/GlpR transcriptional regulator [Burkholderiaceae bacterium]|nr:DeoR/GlpR transcriptional regulator [Burkholderiaceae bacterium]